jgi:hypothetical protein
MLTNINEPIQVEVLFGHGQVRPLSFSWRQNRYPIQKIVFRHQSRQGRTLFSYFSVEVNQLVYELVFNHQDLTWYLIKLYQPGDL